MRYPRVLLFTVLLGIGRQASAESLTTGFGATNIGAANWTSFFDLTVSNPSGVTFREVTVDAFEGANGTLSIYVRPTTYVGSETTAAGWTFISSGTVVGGNGPTNADVSDFILPSGTYGIAMFNENYRVEWTSPATDAFNSDLFIDSGAASGGPFSGTVFTNARWNGTLTYDVGIPEPAGLPLLATALLALRRRRRDPSSRRITSRTGETSPSAERETPGRPS
jgi:hypothetical protein